jgi:hypothetical protein
VKNLSSRRAAFTLLAPVFLILTLALLSDMRPASAAKVPSGDGTIQLAFISTLETNGNAIISPIPFQHLYLNVVGLRLNTNAGAAVGAKGWVTIPAPTLPGIGNKAGTPQLTIDLTQTTQLASFFNNFNIKANTGNQAYGVIELLLNSTSPGSIVPLCSGVPSPGEGCSAYPITFASGSNASIFTNPEPALTLAKQAILPLVINITVNVPTPLTVTGGAVVIDQPSIAVIPNSLATYVPPSPSPKATPTLVPINPYLGMVAGQVKNTNGSTGVINAEPAGTSDLISSVNPFNVKGNGSFIFYLPAVQGGTAYDLYVRASDRDFGVASDLVVVPDAVPSPASFTLATHGSSQVKGSLVDACTGDFPPALQNTTITILEAVVSPTPTPGKHSPTPSPTNTPDCGAIPATDCVVVATAVTDPGSNFPTPVPGTGNGLAAFQQMPQGHDYVLIVDAPGFDRTVIPLVPKNGFLTCVGTHNTKDKSVCDLALSHGYLNGTLALGAVTPSNLTAQVVAEDRGTSSLENTLNVEVPAGQSSGSFPPPGMFIPDQIDPRYIDGSLTGIDLYALVDDDFNGASQPNTGHSIAVEAGLPIPAACATSVTDASLTGVTCTGHGSIEGSLTAAGGGTTVALEVPDPTDTPDLVQVVTGGAGPYGDGGGSGYALCAPAGDYTLQRFDDGVAGAATPVAIASPVVTAGPTPCPAICDGGQGTSCLVCTGTAGPTL